MLLCVWLYGNLGTSFKLIALGIVTGLNCSYFITISSTSFSKSSIFISSNTSFFTLSFVAPNFTAKSLYFLPIFLLGLQPVENPQLKQLYAILGPVLITPALPLLSLHIGQLKVTQPAGVFLCFGGI